MSKTFVITGGCGFIGKHFTKKILNKDNYVINIDALTYCSDKVINKDFEQHKNYIFINKNICDLDHLPDCDYLVNFAAETHVDNSINDNDVFIKSNIQGIHNILKLIAAKDKKNRPRLFHISTDEVYGDILDGFYNEDSVLRPSNPYAATKASADMLIKSWGRTYGIDWNIIRPSNNYGPLQFHEKLIPRSCQRLLNGYPAMLHGNGEYIRSWLHVEDNCEAIQLLIDEAKINNIYNIGSNEEISNINVIDIICDHLKINIDERYVFVEDRSGQDLRYAIKYDKLKELGWTPKRRFKDSIKEIIEKHDISRFL